MPKATGQVWKIFERAGKYGKMYSIKLDGDDNFYGCKSKDPRKEWGIDEGDMVEFEYSMNAKGYTDVDGAVAKVEAAPEEGAPPDAPAAGSAARESFDRSFYKDAAYNWRAARGQAQELVLALLAADLLTLPTKGGKAEKEEAVKIYVNQYALEIFKENWAVTNGTLPTDEDFENV